MKNIFSLLIILATSSMWAVAKAPFPVQPASVIGTNQPSALSMEQVDPTKGSSGPNPTGVVTIDQAGNSFISIYPNPATTYIDIKLTSAGESKVNIALYDVTGKLIKSIAETPVGEKAVRVTRDNLPAGVYFLMVKTSAGQQCRKVIFS